MNGQDNDSITKLALERGISLSRATFLYDRARRRAFGIYIGGPSKSGSS